MPLPLPTLDQRRYDDLVAEAVDLLPRAAPQWTEHNASDPGVTLIELLAYLAEQGHYKLDRITPEQRRAWLRLIGYAPRPARRAQALLAFDVTVPGAVTRVPAGLQVRDGQGVVFETQLPLDAIGAKLTTLLTRSEGRDTVHPLSPVGEVVSTLLPFGPDPRPGDALCIGFDRPLAGADRRLRMAFWGQDPTADAATWQQLIEEVRARRRDPACEAAARPSRHYGVRVAWEYWDAGGRWRPLPRARDGTRALSLGGTLRFGALAVGRHAAGAVAAHPGAYFIRARLLDGVYDEPPRLAGLALNAVKALHGASESHTFGPSDGSAGQKYRLTHLPVAAGTARLDLRLKGAREAWAEVPDWDASGPDDLHFVLDAAAGEIHFGDGRRGRVPAAGTAFELRYAHAAGNTALPAGSLSDLVTVGPNNAITGWPALRQQLKLRQPFATLPGDDIELTEQAEGRAATSLPQARCAATLHDFERLALAAPGLPVARAYAISGFHPRLPGLPAEGCIAVVVLPRGFDRRPDPSPALLTALHAYLNRRRPLTSELHVCGPRWTKVTVHARLHVARGTESAAAASAARAALVEFFHPLRGGPQHEGWPAGRHVHRSEVFAVLMGVGCVAAVSDLELQLGSEPPARCASVVLCSDALVLGGEHELSATMAEARSEG